MFALSLVLQALCRRDNTLKIWEGFMGAAVTKVTNKRPAKLFHWIRVSLLNKMNCAARFMCNKSEHTEYKGNKMVYGINVLRLPQRKAEI